MSGLDSVGKCGIVCERERSGTRAKQSFGDMRSQAGAWERGLQSCVWANRATHAVLHDSERLDVSPPCVETLLGQRTSIWHEGLTSARSLPFRPRLHAAAAFAAKSHLTRPWNVPCRNRFRWSVVISGLQEIDPVLADQIDQSVFLREPP